MHLYLITVTFVVFASINSSCGTFNASFVGDDAGNGPNCRKTGICSCDMSDGSGIVDLHAISSVTNNPRFKLLTILFLITFC